ncbi:MFS transporter [Pseudonocardia ailaonensis]|uniref:MFS transporter n=1 Tax=Pseudonocardia ailaonensis TaxID=367279 RepID=A0ABN2MMD4_9PSEU
MGPPGRGRLGRGALYAGGFIGPFGGGITASMLPELGADFHVSPGTASLSLTVYMVPFAAVMLVSGTLGERWGRARTVRLAYLLFLVSSLACALAPGWVAFLGARALGGIANAFTTPLLMAALGASASPGVLGRVLGWYGSLQAAGQTFAPLIGGLAAEASWRWAFAGVAVVSAVLAVLGIPVEQRGETVARPSLRSAWTPTVLRLGIVSALAGACLAGLGFLVALRLDDVFALDAGLRGLVLTALGAVGIVTARVIGSAVDRVGGRRCVVTGALAGGLLVAGIGLAPSLWLVVAFWAAAGAASQLIVVGMNTLVLSGPGANRGGAVSVVQALRFTGYATSPAVLPPVYHADPLVGFLLPAGLLAIGAPLALPRPSSGRE